MKTEKLQKTTLDVSLDSEKRKVLKHLLILGIWALIQYVLGTKFGIVCIALFALFIMTRPPNITLLAASIIITVLLNTPTLDTLAKLFRSNVNAIRQINQPLTNIFKPRSGQEVLSKQVRCMLNLLEMYHITSYRLSNKLSMDMYIQQRITEVAWPIKMEGTSPYILSAVEEISSYPECEAIEKREDVALVYCR